MNNGYEKDIILEHKFSRRIRSVLGMLFFEQDPEYDKELGTDFVIFTVPNKEIRVAVRLRRYEYWLRFPNQFTLRWERPSGIKTEIHKIREGLVNYMLYGFVNKQETQFAQYFIADLSVFREYDPKPIGIFKNNPPDSKLAVYNISQFPQNFIMHWYKK